MPLTAAQTDAIALIKAAIARDGMYRSANDVTGGLGIRMSTLRALVRKGALIVTGEERQERRTMGDCVPRYIATVSTYALAA